MTRRPLLGGPGSPAAVCQGRRLRVRVPGLSAGHHDGNNGRPPANNHYVGAGPWTVQSRGPGHRPGPGSDPSPAPPAPHRLHRQGLEPAARRRRPKIMIGCRARRPHDDTDLDAPANFERHGGSLTHGQAAAAGCQCGAAGPGRRTRPGVCRRCQRDRDGLARGPRPPA